MTAGAAAVEQVEHPEHRVPLLAVLVTKSSFGLPPRSAGELRRDDPKIKLLATCSKPRFRVRPYRTHRCG